MDLTLKPVGELPTAVDWRKANIVSPVKDQGSCGSCWAFASTAVLESFVAKESGLLFDFSVEQVGYYLMLCWVDRCLADLLISAAFE